MLESARFTESAKKLLWAGAEATATKLSNMLVNSRKGKTTNGQPNPWKDVLDTSLTKRIIS